MITDDDIASLTGGKDGWSLERVSGGFQGEHFILRAGERSWFVKAQPRTEIGKVFERTGIFEKEPKVYSELFPRLQPFLKENDKLWPEAYICRTGLLVLEDLRGANWRPAPPILDHAHLKAALTSLAAFHSTSLLLELTGASLEADYTVVVRESYFSQEEGHPGMATWTSFISTSGKILRDYFPGRDLDGTLSELSSVPQFVKPSRTFKNCLCHGDLWKNNIFFKYENDAPVSACFVDFAQVRYCPPSLDVLHLLEAAQVDDITTHLDHYYSCLSARLPPSALPRQEFDGSLPLATRFARCLAPLYAYLTRLPASVLAEVTTSGEAFWEFALGKDQPAIAALREDLEYREAVLAAYRKLLELA